MRIFDFSFLLASTLACVTACQNGSDEVGGDAGSNRDGSASTQGGSSVGTNGSGGTSAKGGTTTAGGTTSGAGTVATGGTTSSSGTMATGGGNAKGGTTSQDGAIGNGGTIVADGSVSTGGAGGSTDTPKGQLKPRMIALTDISTWETDDHESMTRLLAHADLFEIEGLMLSTGYSIDGFIEGVNDIGIKKGFISIIHDVINAYEKDLPNLIKRSNQTGHQANESQQIMGYWPSPKYLRDMTMFGSGYAGQAHLGEKNISDGSNHIIKLADEADDRPIWVTVWGGGNTLAQSIWQVKKDRTPEQLKAFLQKVRIYTITDQDRGAGGSSHGWMRSTAGADLKFIWDECAWKAHNSAGKGNWGQYTTHIQGHGNLGKQYPAPKYGVEGDTPSFLYVMPTGLNDPEDPRQCSWGGTFGGGTNNLWQPSSSCGSYFGRFYPVAFNNFAARMDWAKDGTGNRNPIVVMDGDTGYSVIKKSPKAGSSVVLDASKTTDPDGNNLKFNWWVQADAGSYSGKVTISGNTTNTATIAIPSDAAGKTFHVICEVTDDGTHNLSSYRRILFEPN